MNHLFAAAAAAGILFSTGIAQAVINPDFPNATDRYLETLLNQSVYRFDSVLKVCPLIPSQCEKEIEFLQSTGFGMPFKPAPDSVDKLIWQSEQGKKSYMKHVDAIRDFLQSTWKVLPLFDIEVEIARHEERLFKLKDWYLVEVPRFSRQLNAMGKAYESALRNLPNADRTVAHSPKLYYISTDLNDYVSFYGKVKPGLYNRYLDFYEKHRKITSMFKDMRKDLERFRKTADDSNAEQRKAAAKLASSYKAMPKKWRDPLTELSEKWKKSAEIAKNYCDTLEKEIKECEEKLQSWGGLSVKNNEMTVDGMGRISLRLTLDDSIAPRHRELIKVIEKHYAN